MTVKVIHNSFGVIPLRGQSFPFSSSKTQRHDKSYILGIAYFFSIDEVTTFVRLIDVSLTQKTNSVRFTTKGQVVIPSWLRKQFQIEEGTKAIVQATPEGILLKPVTSWAIERGFGMLKRKPGDNSFNEEWAKHKREERELEDK